MFIKVYKPIRLNVIIPLVLIIRYVAGLMELLYEVLDGQTNI